MRNRTPLYCIAGLLLAAVLVCASTNVAAGNKRSSHAWIMAQKKSPLLWMVDGCALIILLESWLLGAAISGLQGESASQTDENARHISVLTETVQDLFRQNNEYASRLEALEQTGDAWHEGFEEEARRLTEQAFLALSDNIESNALQLEAVNLALRYQRAEMQAVRSAFKTGEIAPPAGAPPPLDPVDRPIKPILPEWNKPQNEIPAPTDPDLERDAESHIEPLVDPDEKLEIHSNSSEEKDELELDIQSEDALESADLSHETDAVENSTSVVEQDADQDDEKELVQPSLVPEQTVNAGTAVVETLEFDAAADTADIGDHGSKDASSKTGMAADEFRRSKQEPQSIFRQKRR